MSRGIAVSQISKNGEFIKMYINAKEASRQTGINYSNISRACNNKRLTAGGYYWHYGNLKDVKPSFCQCCGMFNETEQMVLIKYSCLQKMKGQNGL